MQHAYGLGAGNIHWSRLKSAFFGQTNDRAINNKKLITANTSLLRVRIPFLHLLNSA
jgi:hypothetical protein